MGSMSSSPGVMFWDFDGTLAHRPDGWSGTLAASLRDCLPNCTITRDDIVPFLARGFPWHTPDIPHPEIATPDQWWRSIEQLLVDACISLGIAAETAADAARRTRRRYTCPDGWIVYDDVIPTLSTLCDRGWRHAIISNHVPELPDLVASLGLAAYIDFIITSATAGYEKPHRGIYQAALQAVPLARSVWMVGDNLAADV